MGGLITPNDYKEMAAQIIERVLVSDMDQEEFLAEVLAAIYYDGRKDGFDYAERTQLPWKGRI